MNKKEFIEQRDELLAKKEEFNKAIDLRYTEIHDEYIQDCSPVKTFKVYELVENGNRRLGFKRFVIYSQKVSNVFGGIMIRVGGCWLDANNVPVKWDIMTVEGIGNPAIFKLSDNQIHEKHPDSDDFDEAI